MKSQSIQNIKSRFRHEWLLIAVDKMDETTTTPVKGQLLAHSPHRDRVYDLLIREKRLALVMYSDDNLPKGYAMGFHA